MLNWTRCAAMLLGTVCVPVACGWRLGIINNVWSGQRVRCALIRGEHPGPPGRFSWR
jgi:hypothetical protein